MQLLLFIVNNNNDDDDNSNTTMMIKIAFAILIMTFVMLWLVTSKVKQSSHTHNVMHSNSKMCKKKKQKKKTGI